MHRILTIVATVALATGCASPSLSWRADLAERLPVLGHRNFVVVADSAYPEQANPGITTIYTGEEHLRAVSVVLDAIDAAPHVGPVIYIDAELGRIPESDAPGIDAFRAALDDLLAGRPIQRLDHMAIIEKLDASAELFSVLILKTNLTLPYTSVFIELDCGYWGPAEEGRLRAD